MAANNSSDLFSSPDNISQLFNSPLEEGLLSFLMKDIFSDDETENKFESAVTSTPKKDSDVKLEIDESPIRASGWVAASKRQADVSPKPGPSKKSRSNASPLRSLEDEWKTLEEKHDETISWIMEEGTQPISISSEESLYNNGNQTNRIDWADSPTTMQINMIVRRIEEFQAKKNLLEDEMSEKARDLIRIDKSLTECRKTLEKLLNL